MRSCSCSDEIGRVCSYILLASAVGGIVVGCQPTTRPPRLITSATIVPFAELQAVLESGSYADISDPSRGDDTVALPRIPNSIERSFEQGYHAVFVFGGEERRIELQGCQASVLTDGEECVVVNEEECGLLVRMVKIDKAGNILFEFSECYHYHVQSRVCLSRKHGLIFVYIAELAEVRGYTWADCALEFRISLPRPQPSLLVISADEEYLYVEQPKEPNTTREVVVRKYKITDLLQPD